MKWVKKILGLSNKTSQVATTQSLNELAVDTLMRKLCDINACLPILEKSGLSKETISRIYNLTVIACSMGVLERELSQEQLPQHYIIEDPSAGEIEIRFDECEIYNTAKNMVKNYGQADVIVASVSGQMRALNWCFNKIGEKPTKEDISRIRILPPKLPTFGQAATKALVLPTNTQPSA